MGNVFLLAETASPRISGTFVCSAAAAAAGNLTLYSPKSPHPSPLLPLFPPPTPGFCVCQAVDYSINLIMRCQSFRCLGQGTYLHSL